LPGARAARSLIGFISVGLGSAVLYLLRLALYSPDVRYGLGCPGHPWASLGHPWDGWLCGFGVGSCMERIQRDRFTPQDRV
uniref:Uncharacterized protein n=1 Tax=Malurus cyaneus samueli TaxID=2593467 RepID=A0A8C5U7L0_9PASS